MQSKKLLQIENNMKNGSRNPKWLIQRQLNKTVEQDHPYSHWNQNNKKKDSSTLSGLSMKDEWNEIQWYNGVLHKIKKDHEFK